MSQEQTPQEPTEQIQDPVDSNHRLTSGDIAMYSTAAAVGAVLGAGLGHNAVELDSQSEQLGPEVTVSSAPPEHVTNPMQEGRIVITDDNRIILPPVELPGQEVRTTAPESGHDASGAPVEKGDPIITEGQPPVEEELAVPPVTLPGEQLAPGVQAVPEPRVQELPPPQETEIILPPVDPGDTIPPLPDRRDG